MNRTDFFKQIGSFAAGVAAALSTKLSTTKKDEMKVTNSITLRTPTGEVYSFVVVPKPPDNNKSMKVRQTTIHIESPHDEIRDLNV